MARQKTTKVVIIHIIPPILSGGAQDARLTLKHMIKEFKINKNKPDIIIMTNDKILIKDIVNSYVNDMLMNVIYIKEVFDFLQLFKLLPQLSYTITKIAFRAPLLLILVQEYPQITVPIIGLVKILSKRSLIIIKLHSVNYLREFRKFVLNTITNTMLKIFYAFSTFLFSFMAKYFVDVILVPNPYLSNILSKRYRKPVLFIPPGNYIPEIAHENLNIKLQKLSIHERCLLFPSSKITLFDIYLILHIINSSNFKNSKICIIGKWSQADIKGYNVFSKIMQKTAQLPIYFYVTLEGLNHYLILLYIKASDLVIYTSYLDTWSYIIFESLTLNKKVIFIAQNELTYNMIKSLIELLKIKHVMLVKSTDITHNSDIFLQCPHSHKYELMNFNKIYIKFIIRLIQSLAKIL